MILRHLAAILLLPFVVTVVVPVMLLKGGEDPGWPAGHPAAGPARAVGLALIATGGALFAWCVALFARVGRGTLAPWDPTRRLVAAGPYRHVRNPMITGVALVLAGEALFRGSRPLALWAGVFVLVNHVYFLAVEEPGLRRRFGEDYRAYAARVPRWLPRLRRAPGGSAGGGGAQSSE